MTTAVGDGTQTVAQEFPTMAWMLSIPELAAILQDPKYDNNPQSANEIQAAIQQTNWYKTTSPSMQSYLQDVGTNPADVQQALQQKESDIWDQYLKAGLTPDVAEVQSLALNSIQQGWTSSQLNDAITAHAATNPDQMGQVGAIQTTGEQLSQYAATQGVSIDPVTLRQWGVGVQAGEHNVADYQTLIDQAAKNKYSYSPGVTNALNSGMTVSDYFAPYAAEASKLLETNVTPGDFLSDPQYAKVADYSDPTTGARREMTLPEMDTYVKSMDQWKGTQQGQQQASSMAQGILQMFGKVSGGTTGF